MKKLIILLFEIQALGADLHLSNSANILTFTIHMKQTLFNRFGFFKQVSINLKDEHAEVIISDITKELEEIFRRAEKQSKLDFETVK